MSFLSRHGKRKNRKKLDEAHIVLTLVMPGVMAFYTDSWRHRWASLCILKVTSLCTACERSNVNLLENPTLPTLAVNAKDPRKFALYRDTLLRGRALLKTAVQVGRDVNFFAMTHNACERHSLEII